MKKLFLRAEFGPLWGPWEVDETPRKRGFSNSAFHSQLFKTRVLTQPDFENPKKIHFKPEKGHFWFTLKGPVYNQ